MFAKYMQQNKGYWYVEKNTIGTLIHEHHIYVVSIAQKRLMPWC